MDDEDSRSKRISEEIVRAILQDNPELKTGASVLLPAPYLLGLVAKHGEGIRQDFISSHYARQFVQSDKSIGEALQNAWKARSFEQILQMRAHLSLFYCVLILTYRPAKLKISEEPIRTQDADDRAEQRKGMLFCSCTKITQLDIL